MKALFDAQVAKEVEKAKAEFLKGTTPTTGKDKKSADAYTEAEKAGNVRGMLGAKLQKYHNRDEE